MLVGCSGCLFIAQDQKEYSLKEIAEKIGTKPKTIKSRIHEGKKKLKKRIKRGGNAYG